MSVINAFEGGVHRNLRDRFPLSSVTPRDANARLHDYVLRYGIPKSDREPSITENCTSCYMLILPIYRLSRSARTIVPMNRSKSITTSLPVTQSTATVLFYRDVQYSWRCADSAMFCSTT